MARPGPGGQRTWDEAILSGPPSQFPPLVSATKPVWQDASDRREQLMRERGPQLTLFLLGLALLIAIGGGIAVLAVWWTRGRDPEIGPVPEIIPVTPPADLPPAVVGALVDEQVDQRDIVATLVDLGRRGILRIDPGTSGRLQRDSVAGSPRCLAVRTRAARDLLWLGPASEPGGGAIRGERGVR